MKTLGMKERGPCRLREQQAALFSEHLETQHWVSCLGAWPGLPDLARDIRAVKAAGEWRGPR